MKGLEGTTYKGLSDRPLEVQRVEHNKKEVYLGETSGACCFRCGNVISDCIHKESVCQMSEER